MKCFANYCKLTFLYKTRVFFLPWPSAWGKYVVCREQYQKRRGNFAMDSIVVMKLVLSSGANGPQFSCIATSSRIITDSRNNVIIRAYERLS